MFHHRQCKRSSSKLTQRATVLSVADGAVQEDDDEEYDDEGVGSSSAPKRSRHAKLIPAVIVELFKTLKNKLRNTYDKEWRKEYRRLFKQFFTIRADDPTAGPKPYDFNRDGFIMKDVSMIDPKAMCGAFWLDLCQSVWCQSGACSNFCAAPPLPPRLSPDAIEQYCCFFSESSPPQLLEPQLQEGCSCAGPHHARRVGSVQLVCGE